MSPSPVLQLVPAVGSSAPVQLLLRPVVAFVDAEIAPPFRIRLACRRLPVRRAQRVIAAPPWQYAGDLETWRPARRPKSRTIVNTKPLTRAEREFGREIVGLRVIRPIVDGRCANEIRPCPYACPMHLGIDVTDVGSLRVVFPDRELDIEPSCALDVADRGPQTQEEIGRVMNVGVQRAAQLVDDAVDEMAAKLAAYGIEGNVKDLLRLAAGAGLASGEN